MATRTRLASQGFVGIVERIARFAMFIISMNRAVPPLQAVL